MSEERPQGQELAGIDLDWSMLKDVVKVLTSDDMREFLTLVTGMIESGKPSTRYEWAVIALLCLNVALQAAIVALVLGAG